MKVTRNNKLYVQNKDLVRLLNASIKYNLGIPSEVIEKVYGDVFIVNDDNKDDYVSFEDPASIEFFSRLPYIVDYDEITKLSEKEIVKLIESTMDEVQRICDEFNSKEEKTSEEYCSTIESKDLLEHKFFDLRLVLWEKQGHSKVKLPTNSLAQLLRQAFSKRGKK